MCWFQHGWHARGFAEYRRLFNQVRRERGLCHRLFQRQQVHAEKQELRGKRPEN